MNDDLARLPARLGLETHAEPAVRLVVLLEAARRDRVGEDEEGALAAEFCIESLDEQRVFVIKHAPQARPAHVAIARTVDRVAERHIVCGHRLRDRPCCAADVEEAPRYFLA